MHVSFLSEWRKFVFLVPLSFLISHCHRETPQPPQPRLTEPRLSGFDGWQRCPRSLPAGHVVETFDCKITNPPADLVSLAVSECDDKMSTAAEAVRVLVYAPQCTDAAVGKLEAFAGPRSDAAVMSDLAGAYYVRAQRKDQPSDFVRSLDMADRVMELAPAMAPGRFNRALALEALGFENDAIEAWDALRKDSASGGWATEAGEHLQRLQSQRSRAAAQQWPFNESRLQVAAESGDQEAMRQLVSPFRRAVAIHLEEDILPAWADASANGRAEEARKQLQLAGTIASALAELTGDRYPLDVVERIRSNSSPEILKRLQDGHRDLKAARAMAGGTTAADRAAAFERAAQELAAAGSPLQLGAMLGRVAALTQDRHYAAALELLQTVERAASEHRYTSLLPFVHTGRGYLLMVQERDLDALAEYSAAQDLFKDVGDTENIAHMQIFITGLIRRIGDDELTWRAAFQAERYAAGLVDPQLRHIHLGEHALSAVELGYPAVALRYQNQAVTLLQGELSRSGDENLSRLRHNLGVALRTRAGIYAYLKRRDAAESDLAASTRLLDPARGGTDLDIPLGFRAGLLEVEAQQLANVDRRRAIEALSKGIALASRTYYRTLAASMRVQRAELYRLDGNSGAATEDLQGAIASLRAEEKDALEGDRRKGLTTDVRIWSAYFSRSQEAYRRLIEIFVEEGDDARAFEYAEKARGYEPLYRILQRGDLPPAFREQIQDNEPLRLAEVQQYVPAGTFLLEYSVHANRTYVWIIGPDSAERRTLQVGESTIRDWTRSLQRFASLRDSDRFGNALREPYKALLEEPLTIVAKLQGRKAPAAIVVVPDRSMHGLPFSALRNGSRYLIEERAVAVAGSATLYAFSLVQDRQLSRRREQSVLLFADPSFDPHMEIAGGLSRLTSARSEAARIREVYRSVAEVEPPRMDARATAAAFLRLAADNTIIHLAVHGVANPDVPSRSFLLLAPAGDDAGALDAERLSKQLHLTRTRLAVLSACSSAGGTPVGPEGLSPLVRPLIVAGVPGVVGTLWNVSDSVATEDLLVRFHQYYRDGRDAGDALRQAQLDMLSRLEQGHRAAWGWSAFQMNGYASSPFQASAD